MKERLNHKGMGVCLSVSSVFVALRVVLGFLTEWKGKGGWERRKEGKF